MTSISIAEYGTSAEVLPVDEAHALVAASGGALLMGPPERGGVRLIARQHVGIVAAGGREVRITPKAPLANVLGMLATSTGLTVWHPGDTNLAGQDDLLRVAIAFLAHSASRLIGAGAQRAYVRQEDELFGPRGRILFDDLARRGGVPSPLLCAFDELTTDTLLNRYLLAAISKAVRVPHQDHSTVRLLRHVQAALPEVRRVPMDPTAIDRHHFTRLDERYRPTIALARLILERLSVHHHDGSYEVRSFTVDMNRLFEAWVGIALAVQLPVGFSIATQTPRHLDTNRRIAIAPDLEIQRAGRAVYVADTKYKLTASGVGRIGDYYQAHAYATVLGLPEAMLIYCDSDGKTPARSLDVIGSNVTLRTHAVSLAGTATDLAGEIAGLADLLVTRSRPVAVA